MSPGTRDGVHQRGILSKIEEIVQKVQGIQNFSTIMTIFLFTSDFISPTDLGKFSKTLHPCQGHKEDWCLTAAFV